MKLLKKKRLVYAVGIDIKCAARSRTAMVYRCAFLNLERAVGLIGTYEGNRVTQVDFHYTNFSQSDSLVPQVPRDVAEAVGTIGPRSVVRFYTFVPSCRKAGLRLEGSTATHILISKK